MEVQLSSKVIYCVLLDRTLQYLKSFATPRDLGVMPLGFLEGFGKLFWGNQNPGPPVGF